MSRTTIDFGIDLGTTNSTIAVIEDTGTVPIPNKGGSLLTPSAVCIDKRGSILVGHEARLRAQDDPYNADVEFKLRMGLAEDGVKVFRKSGRRMLPEELSAEVLKSLKMDVQSNRNEHVSSAVITVPAAFELPQTSATQRAAKLAGFELSPLVLEPVAASLAYGFQTSSENVYWLVFDFGGGTFDAALMRVRDGLIQVVNHDGDNHLGGKLIDWDIVTKRLAPAMASEYALPDFTRNNDRWRTVFAKLKYHSELAKIEVCRTGKPKEIWIEDLCTDDKGTDVDFAFTLTPQDIEAATAPHLARALRLCRKTLQDTGLAAGDLERILMVGGSTLSPWVREAVEAEFGNRLDSSIDPVTVVARGAAIFASTQAAPSAHASTLAIGTWRIEIEHEPVGSVTDPDIGGRIVAPSGRSTKGCTIEFVDTKTQWRSGRVALGAEGVFMTELFADERRRCSYDIEFCDPTGTRLPTSPERVTYTLGVMPDKPPAPHSIGLGLANDEVKVYVRKGARLPAKSDGIHRSTVALRKGNADDVIRIALIEGENARATRNHPIGEMTITGADVKRNVPVHSEIEVSVTMDEYLQVRVLAYLPVLDEEIEMTLDLKKTNDSIAELRAAATAQTTRLATAREKAERSGGSNVTAPIARIEEEQLVEEVGGLLAAAEMDPDARSQLDRRLRDLTSAIDDVEDAVEWPVLLESAETERSDAEGVVRQHGNAGDEQRYRTLAAELEQAIQSGDPDLLRRRTSEMVGLWFEVVERLPAYHISRFENLVGRMESMDDTRKAEDLVSQGRRAMGNDDIEALKAANRQLVGLLPRGQQKAMDKRQGTII